MEGLSGREYFILLPDATVTGEGLKYILQIATATTPTTPTSRTHRYLENQGTFPSSDGEIVITGASETNGASITSGSSATSNSASSSCLTSFRLEMNFSPASPLRASELDDNPGLSPEEELLNSKVLRVAADPQGRHPNGLANFPPISGNISVPILTLHSIGDLYVPFLMQQVYAQWVAAQGKSNLLVQRVIRDVGHCSFTVNFTLLNSH